MDARKWFPSLPLFHAPACLYCGGPADTTDHTPPRCLLPDPFPADVQAMSVPACTRCNSGFSRDELWAAAVIGVVSFTETDKAAIADGGWIHRAMTADRSLRAFITERRCADGTFQADTFVLSILARVMTKTAAGLLFHEFGRVVPLESLKVLAIEHAQAVRPSALAELYRRDDGRWAEVTPSGRELERQVLAVEGYEPRFMPPWQTYVQDYFEYMFVRRSNRRLLLALKLHEAVTVLVEAPWPGRAGPRRRGRPPFKRRSGEIALNRHG